MNDGIEFSEDIGSNFHIFGFIWVISFGSSFGPTQIPKDDISSGFSTISCNVIRIDYSSLPQINNEYTFLFYHHKNWHQTHKQQHHLRIASYSCVDCYHNSGAYKNKPESTYANHFSADSDLRTFKVINRF